LPKGDRQPDPESVAATAADTANINLYVDDHRHRLTTLKIVNAPSCNNMGIYKESQPSTTTVTGSLLQKLVTLAAANLGSCDKNIGKADTTMNTDAIFGKKEAAQRGYTRGATEQKAVGGGIMPNAGKHSKNLKN
jgi:hypothetical protein